MMKCTCAECGITKTKFVKGNQTGGASRSTIRRIQNRGPSAVDKAAYVLSNFVTPAPSFAGLQVQKRKTKFEGFLEEDMDFI